MRVEGFTVGVHVHPEPFNAAHIHQIFVPFFLKFQFLFARFFFKRCKIFDFYLFVGFGILFLGIVLLVDAIKDAPFQVLLPAVL